MEENKWRELEMKWNGNENISHLITELDEKPVVFGVHANFMPVGVRIEIKFGDRQFGMTLKASADEECYEIKERMMLAVENAVKILSRIKGIDFDDVLLMIDTRFKSLGIKEYEAKELSCVKHEVLNDYLFNLMNKSKIVMLDVWDGKGGKGIKLGKYGYRINKKKDKPVFILERVDFLAKSHEVFYFREDFKRRDANAFIEQFDENKKKLTAKKIIYAVFAKAGIKRYKEYLRVINRKERRYEKDY